MTTDPTTQSDYEVALMLLPWYAKDSLTADVKSWVAEQVENNVNLEEELNKIIKQIAKTENYINNLDTSEFENNPDRLSELISRFPKNTDIEKNIQPVEEKSIWNKIASIFEKPKGSWQAAGALALGIIVLQGVIISQLYQGNAEPDYTTLSEEQVTNQAINKDVVSFLTRFHLNATIYDVDTLLTKYQLSIISGPDAAGIYKLAYVGDPLDEESIDTMIIELEAMNNVIRFIAREN